MDPTDPTELAAIETETASVRAWGLDVADETPTVRLTSSRITAAAVVASLLAVAVAGVVAWQYLRHVDAPVPAPVAVAAAPTPPPPPADPTWFLNGTYRVDIHNPDGIIRDPDGTVSPTAGLGVPMATNFVAYQTTCDPAGCSASSVQLDDVTHQHRAVEQYGHGGTPMLWNGNAWVSHGGPAPSGGIFVPVECASGGGSDTFEVWSVAVPQPDGSVHGTSYRLQVKSGCDDPDSGQYEVPFTAVRVGDVPHGIFP